MAKERSIDFSYHHRAQASIAHGALTNSKRAETHVLGAYPTHAWAWQGCFLFDTKGRKYTDYICGLGTNLLGYDNPEIIMAGMSPASPSLPTCLEVEAAEKIKEDFCFIDELRFLKTGSHACVAAVRAARTYTGRDLILTEGYHGDSDEFVSLTPPALGVMHHDYINKLDFDFIPHAAAVIIEPVELDNSKERIKWLNELRAECTKHNTVLIFDEIITGYRYPLLSVSRKHGIKPDLICLGKAIANGAALSVVGGKKEIMGCDEYFISSTYAGEVSALKAYTKVHSLMRSKYNIEELWDAGAQFIEDFNSLWDKVQLKGYNTRGRFVGSDMDKALFFQESAKAGLLFGPSWFYNFPLIEERDRTMNLLESVVKKIKFGRAKLEGKMPRSPFVERVRRD